MGNPPLARFFWSLPHSGIGVAATLPMLVLFFAMLRWPVGPLGKIKKFFDEQFRLVLASVLFGVAHAITLTYALLAAAMGAWLGWLWLWCDNLLPAILAHALYD